MRIQIIKIHNVFVRKKFLNKKEMWENNKRDSSFMVEKFRTTRDPLSQDLSNSHILFSNYFHQYTRYLKHENTLKQLYCLLWVIF